MNCPKCGYGYSTTIECRNVRNAKRFRKKCSGCGNLYTTYELNAKDYLELRKVERKFDKIKEIMEDIQNVEN